ncbi:hypothetical protein J5N97_024746 [Dioscorea zingiberensis]|uniref:Uncharacterized protein n=1 Tax=Dioscorea zingiberensis TaxID=325984 RepID=A0A9D5C808_9LILI|nr:hypothetical protein J5N97_024746 [Dioscorea zingiberensis]
MEKEKNDLAAKLVISEGSLHTVEENIKKLQDDSSSLKEEFKSAQDERAEARWDLKLKVAELAAVQAELEEIKGDLVTWLDPCMGRVDLSIVLGLWFTLKEGSQYKLKFTFSVSNNIVSGLRFNNKVWKTGVKVGSTKEMLGTYSPQVEPYTCEVPKDTILLGIFTRGSYFARTKFVDDDGKSYLELISGKSGQH